MISVETVPTWVLAYAGIFVLMHLLVGYYLYRRSDGLPVDKNTPAQTDPAVDATRSESGGDIDDEPVVHCGFCHTENEPEYRYCRNCVQELSSMVDTSISKGAPEERESL
ncbi:DUF7577 domain-containing protein [Natranaeroarchaeum sulfidigenes]|uniref:Zn finger protein n=1 Tax=Natranaeroarchaeum sulfidigenes TaxID=2784880 RepID=A0A897MSQ4_9EURY|nr:hypothetical protein [Natranaeroarchaeum sulfidigenes]QSG01989.1 Zn finger protein [Natranaeroarchaeum sulfidigenes]